MKIEIISTKWSNRGPHTSTEKLCSMLDLHFHETNGKTLPIPMPLAVFLKKLTNSIKDGGVVAPYNSLSAKQEWHGIMRIAKNRPDFVFFPYGDYNYYYTRFFKKIFNFKIILYSYFSEYELSARYQNLNHFKDL